MIISFNVYFGQWCHLKCQNYLMHNHILSNSNSKNDECLTVERCLYCIVNYDYHKSSSLKMECIKYEQN